MRSHLNRLELQEGIARYLAAEIGKLTVERRSIEFEKADFRLSQTRPFTWRRDLPPLEARKTVFNFVATYNSFERQFAEFLDRSDDVLRFAALGTTEQGSSGTAFRVDYLKPNGAIGFYYPDWAVVQQTEEGELNWIIETKGSIEVERHLYHLRTLPLLTDNDQSDIDTVSLARRHGLSGYDAAYLETAKRLGADLATLDRKLATASAREGM